MLTDDYNYGEHNLVRKKFDYEHFRNDFIVQYSHIERTFVRRGPSNRVEEVLR